MSKTVKNYFKATGLYTIGNIFNKAMSLLLLPIFTRMLSTSSYGIVSTYNSWVNIAIIIIGLQSYLTLRSAYYDYKEDLNSYISTINTISFIAAVIVLAIAIGVSYLFIENIPIVLVILCVIQAFTAAVTNVELQKEMMDVAYVKRTMLLSLPNLIAALLGISVLLIFPKTDYMGRIGTNALVSVCVGFFILGNYYRKSRTICRRDYCNYALALAVPLIFHGLACEVLSSVDRMMITSFRSTAETGIYSVAYTMGMAIKVIISSVESVWVPWFTSKMNEKKKTDINRVARSYLYIVTSMCISAMLCLPEILKMFADRSYWSGVYIIPPIVLASFVVFLYTLSVDVEYYYKKTKGIAVNTFIAAISNVVLNFIFIPKYGAIAAAFTTVVSYVISFVVHFITARKLDVELFPGTVYVIPIMIAFFGTILTYIFMGNWIIRWSIAIVSFVIMVIFISRKDLKWLIIKKR